MRWTACATTLQLKRFGRRPRSTLRKWCGLIVLDKLTRRTLRSSVAKYGGLPYAGTEIKGIRSYERAGGATWPNSDVFVKLLIQTQLPKLATNPKHAKAGRDLF